MNTYLGRFRKTSCLALVVITMILLIAFKSHAKVYCDDSDFSPFPHIYEEITVGDVQSVDNCIKEIIERRRNVGNVVLDSPGGDVYAAMAIGRLLRKHRLSVNVRPKDQCLSSCVLILAGAVNRILVFGTVGIHRPYSTTTGVIKFDEAQQLYQKTRSNVEEYLREMNLPNSLFVAMERVPPEDMKYLSPEELNEFGLNGLDPVEQEVRDANQADRRGISRQEYLSRVAEAEQLCIYKSDYRTIEEMMNDTTRVSDCKVAMSWGLTPRVYIKRYNLAEGKTCEDIGSQYGWKSVEHRTCYREVMHGTKR